MYDDVLVPTEANPGSERAIDLAVDFADRHGATLHVLYVAEDVDSTADVPDGERRRELPPEGEETIETAENAAETADVPVRTRVGVGDPETAIDHHVDRIDADFVVMGTHGRTGVERLLVGSVAETVVRRADVPVLVVPLDED